MELILGGPGCGKTTALVSIVRNSLRTMDTNQIAFIAFTRKAAREARSRCIRDLSLSADDMPYFRTVHSLCFRQVGLTSNQVMQKSDYDIVASDSGVLVSSPVDNDYGLPTGSMDGDKIIFLEQLSRSTGRAFETLLEANHLNPWHGQQYRAVLSEYKKVNGLVDFSDMVDLFIKDGTVPRLKLLVVDEAQDLSAVHWQVVGKLAEKTEQVVIAGDDDQAIFRWAGADIKKFLNLEGTKKVLPISHRLPRVIFDLANNIVGRISKRYNKKWSPRDAEGVFQHIGGLDTVNKKLKKGAWYLLARHRYLLEQYKEWLERVGYVYDWNGSSTNNSDVQAIVAWERLRNGGTAAVHEVKIILSRLNRSLKPVVALKGFNDEALFKMADVAHSSTAAKQPWMSALDIGHTHREYYRNCLMNGENLLKKPRIKLATIHAVKGGEADNVILIPDMSRKASDTLTRRPDNEHRVFYVGATRARQALFVLHPNSSMSYSI